MSLDPQVPVRRPPPRGLIGPFSGRQLLVTLAAVLVVALGLAVVTAPIHAPALGQPSPGSTFFAIGPPVQGLQPGDLAPELTGVADGTAQPLLDLEGKPITLAALRGRPVWLNFFASWCPPCQQETPILEQVYEAHRATGLALVGISVQETTADDVRSYATTYGLSFPIGFDATSAVFHTYQAYGLPTHYFIDRNGIVRAVWRGPLTAEGAEGLLTTILRAP
ncbi:MAG: TlpA disulfide reductase family protein [Candidatus Limnocylindrales bacterium]